MTAMDGEKLNNAGAVVEYKRLDKHKFKWFKLMSLSLKNQNILNNVFYLH